MNRVINEMTSDEVRRGTGVKVGNFGTGGRTYIRNTHGSSEASKLGGKRAIVGLLLCFVAAWFYYSETGLAQTMQCAAHVQQDAHPVYPPFDIDPKLNNQIVYAASTSATVNSPAPRDTFFGVDFDAKVASARRVTEFCQWEEIEHRRQVKVGTEPNCQTNDDRCNIYREETTYTYHKAWRTHRVSSMRFDNPAAYHNPDRNPCPAETFHAEQGVRLDGSRGQRQGGKEVPMLSVGAADASEALTAWTRVPLGKTTAQATPQALGNGFNEADSQYIYSRGDKDGWTNVIAKAAISYMVDGVVDLGSMGTCHAGDIRVSFEAKTVGPKGMAIAGRQLSNGRMVPFQCRGRAKGKMVLGYPDGGMSLWEMTTKVVSDMRFWTMCHRAGQLAFVAILLAVLKNGTGDKGSRDQDTSIALFLAGAVWGLVWMLNYKLDTWLTLPMLAMAYAGRLHQGKSAAANQEGKRGQEQQPDSEDPEDRDAGVGKNPVPPPQYGRQTSAGGGGEKQSAPLPDADDQPQRASPQMPPPQYNAATTTGANLTQRKMTPRRGKDV